MGYNLLVSFADPKTNISNLVIGEEMKVLDVGAGSGAYTLAAAELAKNGKVYAVDVQKELLAKIKAEGAKRHLHNIEGIWADIEKPHATKLADKIIDVGIVSNILFQVEHKEGLAKEVARLIRPKGKLMVIDWSDSFGGLGPIQRDVFNANRTKGLFENVGFKTVKEFDAGDHHYGIIFERI